LPGPCLATPALSAASSSDVHLCLGAPIPRARRNRGAARNRAPQEPTPRVSSRVATSRAGRGGRRS
jgi:hypothetical protein